jgi:hypothetical protein
VKFKKDAWDADHAEYEPDAAQQQAKSGRAGSGCSLRMNLKQDRLMACPVFFVCG